MKKSNNLSPEIAGPEDKLFRDRQPLNDLAVSFFFLILIVIRRTQT